MKWLVVIAIGLLTCAALSKLSADQAETKAQLDRSRSMVRYLLAERDIWMKSQSQVVQEALKVCKGDFSVCPNGVRGIIENEPGSAASNVPLRVTPVPSPQTGGYWKVGKCPCTFDDGNQPGEVSPR